MKRIGSFIAALVVLLGVTTGAWAATTWTILQNSNCTGLGAATGLTTANVNCCLGVRSGFCDHRGTALGTEFSRIIYAVTGATQTYTTGGDAVAAAQMARIGFSTFVYASCNPSTGGHSVVLQRTTTVPKILLYSGSAAATAGAAPTETASASTSTSNIAVNCVVFGH